MQKRQKRQTNSKDGLYEHDAIAGQYCGQRPEWQYINDLSKGEKTDRQDSFSQEDLFCRRDVYRKYSEN